MDDKTLLAVVAAVSAVLGGVITAVLGPAVKHRLDSNSTEREERRALITKWREMVATLGNSADLFGPDIGLEIQKHRDFMSLEPYLAHEAREAIYKEPETTRLGHVLPKPLETLKSEISRIEREWDLQR